MCVVRTAEALEDDPVERGGQRGRQGLHLTTAHICQPPGGLGNTGTHLPGAVAVPDADDLGELLPADRAAAEHRQQLLRDGEVRGGLHDAGGQVSIKQNSKREPARALVGVGGLLRETRAEAVVAEGADPRGGGRAHVRVLLRIAHHEVPVAKTRRSAKQHGGHAR